MVCYENAEYTAQRAEDNWKCYRSIEIERLIIKTVRKSNIKLVVCVRRQEKLGLGREVGHTD